ncbi:hypothetical protein C8P70_10339 [Myroides indicus]|uniref:Uncharacterized protein n=1 Tax=Myroides indicus TaxID=1323422 RepID=A0A4R7FC61_9FLAO|nr:hypothetical protein C8P70_10339 [Myroides indicus]
MLNRCFVFFKNFCFLLIQSKSQLFSLLSLFKSLAVYDLKSASSVLYFSLESLTSVYRYKKLGKTTTKLIESKKLTKEKHNSLFILGSGPSVNELSKEEWNYIRENDSWGFNQWFCNDFVPSGYIAQSLIEPKNDKLQSRSYRHNKMVSKMLLDKKEYYTDIDFFIRGDAVNRQKFYQTELGINIESVTNGQCSLLAELPVSSSNKIPPDILLNILYEKGFYKIKDEIQPIPKIGSTITELISFALMLGYKEIVLCGIDMNDGGHFYDNEDYFQRYPMLRELSRFNHTRTVGGGHEHMDTSTRPFTIKEYIMALKSLAKSKFNADIYVIRETSTLYPDLPKYKYHE